jgi:glycosyltransferase involved in cell wall biosynthesis
MNPAPDISIITPTKNRLKLLCEAMDSVQAQTFPTWEHLIVDDGSDDGTAEEVARRAEADPRIRYIQRAGNEAGANVCRNLGLRESRADLIVFLDSDDLLMPDCLGRRAAIMQRNAELDFATFQTSVFEHTPGDLGRQLDPELLGDDLLRFLFFECPWQTSGPVWRRSTLERLGGFDESLPSWQDVDLHIRAITAGSRYLRFPEVDHHVRWQFEHTKVSVEQRRSPRHLYAAGDLLAKFERVVREGPGMNWVRQRALCSLYFFVAELWVAAGSLPAALRCWRQIRTRPLGSHLLHVSGASLLVIQALGAPGRHVGKRLAHKWKGWMRLRTNPELVAR